MLLAKIFSVIGPAEPMISQNLDLKVIIPGELIMFTKILGSLAKMFTN